MRSAFSNIFYNLDIAQELFYVIKNNFLLREILMNIEIFDSIIKIFTHTTQLRVVLTDKKRCFNRILVTLIRLAHKHLSDNSERLEHQLNQLKGRIIEAEAVDGHCNSISE